MSNVRWRVQKTIINTLHTAASLSANTYIRNDGYTDRSFNRSSAFFAFALGILIIPSYGFASETSEKQADEVQDMSDPLAVYTQLGLGATNKGINIKIGQSYDTGNDKTMGMNVLEIKGVLGESLGWDGSGQRDDSINSFNSACFLADSRFAIGANMA